MQTGPSRTRYRVVIVGGGVAGAALAYALSERGVGDVLLVEREAQLAYHASGRSAQVLLELERDMVVHRLIVEGARFLRQPPAGFSERPIFRRSGVMLLYDEPEWSDIQRHVPAWRQAGTRLELRDFDAVRREVDLLAPGAADGVLYLPECGRLDVSALLEAYVSHARREGVEIRTGMAAEIRKAQGRVVGVQVGDLRIDAELVVNAAGAWAGQLARTAGATRVSLAPVRRTVVCLDRPAALDADRLPAVSLPSRKLYFATEGSGMLACPMDETLCEPSDVRPDPSDVARALERLAAIAPPLAACPVRTARAGLRTFAPDRRFVIGPDPRLPGFFWLAGQGGWGIETSIALGRIAAELIVDQRSTWPDFGAIDVARFEG